jgi:hypothetical protein
MALSSLTGNAKIDLNWLAKWANSGFEDTKFRDAIQNIQAFAFGTASEQINQIYVSRRTVAPATLTDDLDLSGTLLNPKNETISFSHIKEIFLLNEATVEGDNLVVGGTPAAPWSTPFLASSPREATIYAGGYWHIGAPNRGFTVTAGSGDGLRITHSGVNSITYTIVILGIQ